MTVSVAREEVPDLGRPTLKRGDQRTWERLVAENHSRIYNVLLRMTGDRETAADLTQEAFVAAYKSAHTYNGQAQPSTWLHGVALNCLRDWRRRSGRRKRRRCRRTAAVSVYSR